MNSAVFYNDGETKTAKNDPNYDSEDHPVIWTNVDDFTRVDLTLTSTYTPPTESRDANHYVKDFKVGLEEMKYSLRLYKGKSWDSKVNRSLHFEKYQQSVVSVS